MRSITQRELRNESGAVMRALDRGESFVITRNGVPVGQLVPLPRSHFASRDAVVAAFKGAPAIDFEQFRRDHDAVVDQDPTRTVASSRLRAPSAERRVPDRSIS